MVSIIVPNYNHSRFLKERLTSIFNQTYQNFEVILLDDCSEDHSREILEMYRNHPKVSHFIINEKNSGSPFKQWQKGISLAKGDFIWIAESDDYCELNFLEKTIKNITTEVKLCYVQSIDVDEYGKSIFNREDYTKELTPNLWVADFVINGLVFIKKFLIIKNVIPNASAVVFKKDLISPDIFNDELLNMNMCGDWFFWIKLCNKTKVSFINEPLNYFRNHKGITRNHNSIVLKKQRLLEEATIINYLKKSLGITDKQRLNKLYLTWFEYYKILAIFDLKFYKIAHNFSDKLILILMFVRSKISRYNN